MAGGTSPGLGGGGDLWASGRGPGLPVPSSVLLSFGGWTLGWYLAALTVSRMVPVIAETLSCLAGLGRMDATRFTAALILGTAPIALFYFLLARKAARPARRDWFSTSSWRYPQPVGSPSGSL